LQELKTGNFSVEFPSKNNLAISACLQRTPFNGTHLARVKKYLIEKKGSGENSWSCNILGSLGGGRKSDGLNFIRSDDPDALEGAVRSDPHTSSIVGAVHHVDVFRLGGRRGVVQGTVDGEVADEMIKSIDLILSNSCNNLTSELRIIS